MIKVILWDVDGTLLDFKKAEYVAIKKCFEIFNLGECSDEMISRYSDINRRYWEKLERKEITKPEVLGDIKKTMELSKEQSSLRENYEAYQEYKKVLENIKLVTMMPVSSSVICTNAFSLDNLDNAVKKISNNVNTALDVGHKP